MRTDLANQINSSLELIVLIFPHFRWSKNGPPAQQLAAVPTMGDQEYDGLHSLDT